MISLNSITEAVLAAAFEVSNTLGAGFLEKVYERALMKELQLQSIQAKSQLPIPVSYKGHPIGTYSADILVENTLLLELKCVDHLTPDHLAQCLNYLRATGLPLCLLINFQKPKLEYKRIILTL